MKVRCDIGRGICVSCLSQATCNFFYRSAGARNFQRWFSECKESFGTGFMIIAGYSYNGKLNIHRVAKNTKVNFGYYQANVVAPVYRHDIPHLYGRDQNRVWVHQDKASSHTSRSTRLFLQHMADETGIRAIPFTDIPVKSPDASPMDFCAFGLLKRALSHRRPRTIEGLWKACQEEWLRLDMTTLRASLLQWKLRCRAIAKMQGHQIEHSRWWRRGFS